MCTDDFEKQLGQNDPKIANYLVDLFSPEDSTLTKVKRLAQENGVPAIQVGPMDGLHIETIVRAINAKKVIEIGTLVGYSGIHILRGMPFSDSKLFTFEYNPRHAELASKAFELAGLKQKVEIFVGPAIENLQKIESQGPFDLVFIDADKVGYPHYFNWAAKNLRLGGVLLADNTFGFGMIAEPNIKSSEDEAQILALREFNTKVADSNGPFRGTILPTAEGLTFAIKVR